jgi:hypothetical protein
MILCWTSVEEEGTELSSSWSGNTLFFSCALYLAAAKLFFSCVLSPLSCSSNAFVFSPHLGVCKTFAFLFFASTCSSSSQGPCVEFYYKSVEEGVRICCQREQTKKKFSAWPLHDLLPFFMGHPSPHILHKSNCQNHSLYI